MKKPRDKFTEGLMQAAALGLMPRSIVAMVSEAFTPDRLSLDDRRFLAGPLIVHQNSWTETLPEWLNDAVSAERIGIVYGVTPRYIVGPAEIAAVMYPATMQAPMHSEYADLYLWATINAHAKKHDLNPRTLFGELLNMRPIDDDEVLERGGRLHETYRRLSEDIRRKVINHQAARERGERRGQQQEQKEPAMRTEQAENDVGHDARPARRPVIGEQIMLFGDDL